MNDEIQEFLAVIEGLEELVQKGKRVPLMKWRILADDTIRKRIEALRSSFPSALDKAIQLLQEREGILARALEERKKLIDSSDILQEARREGEQILQKARQDAQKTLDETTKKAQLQGEQIRKDAENYARKSKEKVLHYSLDMLKNLHQTLDSSLENLSALRDTLQTSLEVVNDWIQRILQELAKDKDGV